MKSFKDFTNAINSNHSEISQLSESKDMISKEFKDSIALFFNTWVEKHDMKFGSFDAKAKWSGEQLSKKTAIGKAAVMFAMERNKDVVDAVMKVKG